MHRVMPAPAPVLNSAVEMLISAVTLSFNFPNENKNLGILLKLQQIVMKDALFERISLEHVSLKK